MFDRNNFKNNNIDINKLSRQLGVYGLTTQIKFSQMNILIYGMRGVGIETAKNTILQNPRKVTIFDNNVSKINDLTSNYFIGENDVAEGIRRDEASLKKLSQLNPDVKVIIMENDSIIEHLKENLNNKEEKYDLVVITEFMKKKEIIGLNNYCRNNKIGFIYGCELGINVFCFTDFGDDFLVNDVDGEEPKRNTINSISKSNPGIVNLVHPINDLELGSDDYVIFKEIQGMTELNNISPIKITKIDDYNIQINDTSQFSNYISGGVILKAKIPLNIKFESFEKKIEEPYKEDELPLIIDDCSINEIIHTGILALYKFDEKYNCLPEINNIIQAKELIDLSKEIFIEREKKKEEYWVQGIREEIKDFDSIFEKTIKYLSLWSKVQISPIASFLGGVISQEIVKFTGKFIPFKQWFWCNFNWVIENLKQNKIDRTLKGTRYDDQIAIFGNEIQKKLENTNIFMIGAGALGCEYLKTFSSMGIATDKKKKHKVIVTDNDNIVKSNLTRQFLFREDNIGEPKSKIACLRINDLNQSFNCEGLQSRVGEENENIFTKNIWDKQNFIINAVDNIEARKYIANKSKIYNKILIDSGTNGTKANSQIIIPYKTIDYSHSENNNTADQVPMCTLRNFPSSIEHCIEWARDNFDGNFVKNINDVKLFIEDREKFYLYLSNNFVASDQINKLNKIIRYVKIIIDRDFNECLKIALEDYNENYFYSINRILKKNPPDSLNDDGTRFWSGDKRIPIPLPFDINNELEFMYVKKYATILANSMSIPIIEDNEIIKNKIIEIKSSLVNKENINNKGKFNKLDYFNKKRINKEETRKKIESDNIKLNEIKENIKNINLHKIQKNVNNIFLSQEFEKDDENNGHVDFIFASANLRAELFKIEKYDKIKVQLISGKIIPAIATTTSAIVGLASLQIYSLYQSYNINTLRDNYINLSICSFNFCPPGKYENLNEENNSKINKIKKYFLDLFSRNIFKILIEKLKNQKYLLVYFLLFHIIIKIFKNNFIYLLYFLIC